MNEKDQFEDSLWRFELAWQRHPRPSISEYMNNSEGMTLLLELIRIDLEYQWKEFVRDKRTELRSLSDYALEFAELGRLEDLPIDLIGEEYRARRLWGDSPNPATYFRRFPDRKIELQEFLKQVDEEIQREIDSPASGSPTPMCDIPPDPRANLKYEDYRLIEMIGAGRMGRVYRAQNSPSGDFVAVKFLRKRFSQNAAAVQRFVNEATIVSRLKHSHIVPIRGLGMTRRGGYFLVMDLVECGDLANRVSKAHVPMEDAVRWTRQACVALHHVHQQGIVHCDLKPANLLLNSDEEIRVTDFGLARSVLGEPSLDRIEGTAAYMAPEQVSECWGKIGIRTDVFGIGAVMYELLTGVPPFQGANLIDVLSHVVSGVDVVPPQIRNPDLPSWLSEICSQCLRKQSCERFSDLLTVEKLLRNE